MGAIMLRRCGAPAGLALLVFVAVTATAAAQGLGGAGTIQGVVKDPTGGAMQAVEVRISNRVTGYSRTATTDTAGKYSFSNLPPNSYHLSVEVQGFQAVQRDVDVRSGVPITLDLMLSVAMTETKIDVVGHAEDLVERDPSAHTDIDQSLMAKLPLQASSSGLNQIVTLAIAERDADGSIPRFTRVPAHSRLGQPGVLLRPRRCPGRKHRHAAREPAGGAVVVRRAELA